MEKSFEEMRKKPAESGSESLFNSWITTYGPSSGWLNGLGAGLRVNAASERIVLDSRLTGKFVLPAYTILKASLFYNTSDFRVTVNVDNLTNEDYYKRWSTINPQSPRRVSASFAYKF